MPATLQTTFALVALVRSLAIASQRLLEERPQMQRGDIRRHWIAVENKWLATRYGLEAMYIRTPAGKRRPLKQDLNELLHRLLPIARETGDDVFLATLLPLENFESGADRQRRLYRESGNPRPLIDDMIASLSAELDAGTTQGSKSSIGWPQAGTNGIGTTGLGGNGTQADSTQPAHNQPAATPRASAPPTAGEINRCAPLDLPGYHLIRPPSAFDEQRPLVTRG
jgi:hypothetical protein